MGLRTVLYGYKIENLQFVIVPEEAGVVKNIFSDYISGKTMKQVAEGLTKNNVIYYKDKSIWTKNAICRILENEHYAGDYEYPAIICKEDFLKANAMKSSKGCKKTPDVPEIVFLKKNTMCGQCGHRLTRRRNYSGTRERWECMGHCKINCFLDDKAYFDKLKKILNEVVDNPQILKYQYLKEKQFEPTLDIIRQGKEIDRMLEQKDIQFLPIKSAAFIAASNRFDCCRLDYTKVITDKLIDFLVGQTITDEIDFNLIQKVAKSITVNQDGTIEITFLNDKTIKEQEILSNGNNTSDAESSDKNCGKPVIGFEEQPEQTA